MNDIERLKDLFDREPLYYSISWLTDASYSERVLSPLSEENRGGNRFIELVERARGYGADEIVVKVYRKADKKFRKQPEFAEKIRISGINVSGLQGIDMLGGVEKFVKQQIGLETLKAEVDRLRDILEEEQEEKKELKAENRQLHTENEQLRDRVKALEWEMEKMRYSHHIDLEETERKYRNLDRLLTIGGTALVKAAGVDEQTLYGLLGLDEGSRQLTGQGGSESSGSQVSVNVSAVDESKREAYEIYRRIAGVIERTIKQNTPEHALAYMQGLEAVMSYLHTSEQNFNDLLQLIAGETQKTQMQPQPQTT